MSSFAPRADIGGLIAQGNSGPGPDQGNITSIARCMLAAWVEWEDHEDLVVVFASDF
jgi:hypothetical protein